MVGKSADGVVSRCSYWRVGARLPGDLSRVLFWERYRKVGGDCAGSLEKHVGNGYRGRMYRCMEHGGGRVERWESELKN